MCTNFNIKLHFKQIINFIKVLPILLAETFIFLLLSYGAIAINIMVLVMITPNNIFTVINRSDILNSVLTTSICFMAGIILANTHSRRYLSVCGSIFAVLAATLSALFLVEAENHISLNSYINYAVAVIFTFSVLMALISKYDETKIDNQRYADESRRTNNAKLPQGELHI